MCTDIEKQIERWTDDQERLRRKYVRDVRKGMMKLKRILNGELVYSIQFVFDFVDRSDDT